MINTHMELLHAIYSDCSSTACEIFFLRPASPRARLAFFAHPTGHRFFRRRGHPAATSTRPARCSATRNSLSVWGDTTEVPQSGPHTFFLVIFRFFVLCDGRNARGFGDGETDGEDWSDERGDGSCGDHEDTRSPRGHESYES